ncbi:MAG: protein tyrosine phosphatase [Alphaproteobacteria bacterium]|nr:MAG: protein tyrosine phosphatase [Alphaproteobacteria bacterium]
MLRTRTSRITAAVLLATLILGWLWYDRFIEEGNFSIVIPHTLYRSGTLSHHEWKEIRRDNPPFRSVINLRGAHQHQEWFKREAALSQQSGISFYTYPLSAKQSPTLVTMEALVELMRAAPKPLLVHCKSGSDRTGLALALYAYAIEGKPAQVAAKQLSIRWGHFPWLSSRTNAMDNAFLAYIQAHPQAK